eukprot:EG_transcript_13714
MAEVDVQSKPVAVQALRRLVDATLQLRPDDQPAEGSKSAPIAPVGGVRLALQLLLYHPLDSRIVRTAFGGLLDLLTHGDAETEVRRLLNHHGVVLLTTSMLRHGACRSLLLDGTRLLSTVQKADGGKAALAEQTTLRPLLQALRPWKADAEVMAGGLAVLLQLSALREGRLALTVLGALELCLQAMMLHPNIAVVQVVGCAFLHSMTTSSHALSQMRAVGAVDVLVEAVRCFPKVRRLQMQAIPALYLLCRKEGPVGRATDEGPVTTLGQVGGVEAVVRAMDHHVGDAELARCGGALLRRLSGAKPLRRRMRGSGTPALLHGLLQRHAADAGLVADSMHVLWRLSGSGPAHEVVVKRLRLALRAVHLKLGRSALLAPCVPLPRGRNSKGLGLRELL